MTQNNCYFLPTYHFVNQWFRGTRAFISVLGSHTGLYTSQAHCFFSLGVGDVALESYSSEHHDLERSRLPSDSFTHPIFKLSPLLCLFNRFKQNGYQSLTSVISVIHHSDIFLISHHHCVISTLYNSWPMAILIFYLKEHK